MPEATVDAAIRERLDRAGRPGLVATAAWRRHYARDVATLLRLVDSLADRLHTCSTQLSLVAERKEQRGR